MNVGPLDDDNNELAEWSDLIPIDENFNIVGIGASALSDGALENFFFKAGGLTDEGLVLLDIYS